MKLYLFSLPLSLILVDACVDQKSTSSVNTKLETREDVPKGLRIGNEIMYTNQEAVKFGEQYLDNGDLKTASKLAFNEDLNGRLHLKDLDWEGTWADNINNDKVVFWSTEHFLDVRKNALDDVDIEDMRGFDFAPLVHQMNRVPPWNGGPFLQHYVHIPGKDRNHWKEGSLEYFFMPDYFPFDIDTHIPQYYKYFPDYELPKNKIGLTSFMIFDDTQNLGARKGYTFTGNYTGPGNKRVVYDYDQWLYDSGAPPAYSTGQEEVDKWLASVDERVLQRNFEKYIIDHYKDVGHLVLNWEALRSPSGSGIQKLANCLNKWRITYPGRGISFWPKGLMELNRVSMEGNNYKYQLNDDINFKGSLQDWLGSLGSKSPFRLNDFMLEEGDFNYVGGYLNFPTNYGYVHHMLLQHIMNKKFQPEKKSILMWWHNQEFINGFELGDKWFKNSKDQDLSLEIKPMVFPSAMHNAAVWAFAFCDGGELWSEPYHRMDENEFLGSNGAVTDKKGGQVGTSFHPRFNGQYAVQNYRNIDRWEGGKWSVSMNKDIVEAKSAWTFVSSAREGEKYKRGSQTMPAFGLYEKSQLVAMKYNEAKSEALVLVYDAWNDPLKQEIINVRLKDKVVPIKVFGRYTSVVRISDLD